MDISNINSDLIRGNVTTIILRSLLEEARYGYDILKEIEVKSQGQYKLKQATLYSCLKRLEKQGYIVSYLGEADDTEGGRRRYYALSDEGRAYLLKMQSEYEYSRTILDKLLSDEEYDLTAPAPFDINKLRPYTKRGENEDSEETTEETVATQNPTPAPEVVEEIKPEAAPVTAGSQISIDDIILDGDEPCEEETEESASAETVSEKIVEEAKPTLPKEPEKFDTTPRVTRGSLADLLGKIDDKTGVSADKIEKTLESLPEQQIPAEPQPKREYYRPERLMPTEPEIEEKPSQPAQSATSRPHYNEPVKHVPLSEEQLHSREQAARALGIGRYSDNNKVNLDRFGIERPPEPQQTEDTDDDDGGAHPRKEVNTEEKQSTEATAVSPQPQPVDKRKAIPAFPILEPIMPPKRDASKYSFRTDDVALNHQDIFAGLFSRPEGADAETEEPIATAINPQALTGAELKARLYAEGYSMRTYTRANNENYYASNFLSANRIHRDCSCVMYILLLVEVLIGWLTLKDKLSNNYYLAIIAVGLMVPFFSFVKYTLNPDKRVRAEFDFKLSVLNRFMLYLNFLVILALVSFFGLGADVSDPSSLLQKLFVPAAVLLNIPISSVAYLILYNTRRYHIA